MKHPIGKIRYLAITFGFFFLLTANILDWQDKIIGLASTLGYFLFYGYIAGSIITEKKFWRFILGTTLLTSLLAGVGGMLIYFSSLNQITVLGLLLILPAVLFFPYYKHRAFEHRGLKQIFEDYKEKRNQRNESLVNWLVVASYTLLWIIAGFLIFVAKTNESLQSPWEVINSYFFTVYFLMSALLIFYCIKTTRHYLALIAVNAHALLSVSIAMIIYQIGFGFDPFIHQAAQQIIFETGSITPVTPYYLGQYSIVVFLRHLTMVDISLINKILTPVFFGLIIPSTIFYVFSQWLRKNDALIIALASLVLPYGGFIMSTPQNLANAFFIFTVLMSMLYFKDRFSSMILWLLVFGCALIHPLAGIPLAILIIICVFFKKLHSIYQHTPFQFLLLSLIFIWVMPVIFLITKVATNIQIPHINFSKLLNIKLANTYNFFLDVIYLIQQFYFVIFILICLAGIIYLAKNKLLQNNMAHLAAAIVLLVNFIISKYFLTFGQLQAHDQAEFVNRLVWLSIYTALPIFLIGFYVIYKKWTEKNVFMTLAFILLFAGSLTISLYLSYPRVDTYQPSKLYSISKHDIQAVKLIDQRADTSHVVLANQMVGVTAISQLGFKKYYNDEFYYSMPMGSSQTLYQAYLDMIYQGTKRETMQTVIKDSGVNEAYFVLNSYWNNFEKIANQAKQSADAFYNVNDKVYIFKYVKD